MNIFKHELRSMQLEAEIYFTISHMLRSGKLDTLLESYIANGVRSALVDIKGSEGEEFCIKCGCFKSNVRNVCMDCLKEKEK